jgi:hypothetical protein
MEFALAGKKFKITPPEVTKRMRGVDPQTVRTHGVRLGEETYPVKQVVSLVTGLSKADFNSHQARHILKRMGFPVTEGNGGVR